ncbi:predicted protein [Coccidioides posadasii str. Silveira]|uniref:Predicted protein n=2 Tax=Coccidioides posadasii TaxID=199306 RepID=E9D4C7_COCPS|nr:predicted protein [Coccidioides posadasii str. Silveira]KMM71260.1 hypothetical protein CPAG_07567 [Coccidioides posadasii RMSCC 3488]
MAAREPFEDRHAREDKDLKFRGKGGKKQSLSFGLSMKGDGCRVRLAKNMYLLRFRGKAKAATLTTWLEILFLTNLVSLVLVTARTANRRTLRGAALIRFLAPLRTLDQHQPDCRVVKQRGRKRGVPLKLAIVEVAAQAKGTGSDSGTGLVAAAKWQQRDLHPVAPR